MLKLRDQYFQGVPATHKGDPNGRHGDTRIMRPTGVCSEVGVGSAERNSQAPYSRRPALSLQTSDLTMPCPPERSHAHGLRFSQCLMVSALLLWPGHQSLSGCLRPWHSVVPSARNALGFPSSCLEHAAFSSSRHWLGAVVGECAAGA